MIGYQEAIPIILIIVVLFGAKKLPELGRSLGQGIKEFKKSTKDIIDDSPAEEAPQTEADTSA